MGKIRDCYINELKKGIDELSNLILYQKKKINLLKEENLQLKEVIIEYEKFFVNKGEKE